MADNSANIYPYPFQFDPSQFSNKYSPYNGVPLPSLANYAGMPTDAHGNPIGSYQAIVAQQQAATPGAAPPMAPSTSINSSPFSGVQIPQGQNDAAYQPRGGLNMQQWQALTPQQQLAAGASLGQVQAGVAATQPDSFVASHNNPSGGSPGAGAYLQGLGATAFNQMANQPAAAPQAPSTPAPDMGKAYLQALANPGQVTTPGATVPQSALPSSQSGVLQQFLQNWQNKGAPTTGAGNYNNQGFFAGLQGGQNAQPS
jgi:hypothetical protein